MFMNMFIKYGTINVSVLDIPVSTKPTNPPEKDVASVIRR